MAEDLDSCQPPIFRMEGLGGFQTLLFLIEGLADCQPPIFTITHTVQEKVRMVIQNPHIRQMPIGLKGYEQPTNMVAGCMNRQVVAKKV